MSTLPGRQRSASFFALRGAERIGDLRGSRAKHYLQAPGKRSKQRLEDMKVLLLGVGLQGQTALDDLAKSDAVEHVVAADMDIGGLRSLVASRGYGQKVSCEPLDASDRESLRRLMSVGPNVAIDLLPVEFITAVAEAAIGQGVHLVNTFYVPKQLRELGARAYANGVAILPEFGMDPGIDLVLTGEAVRSLDTVTDLLSYGGGIPAPDFADNPIKYKISWTFEGVLSSYYRTGRVIRDGQVVEIARDEQFNRENIHDVDFGQFGTMEAIANGDGVAYVEELGLDLPSIRNTGRFSLRWPGHNEFWHAAVRLHLLDEEPVMVGGRPVDRQAFLAAAMSPHLQYREKERDMAIIRVVVVGKRGDQRVRISHDVVDLRDLKTGFLAMSRLVGFTASLGAQMLGSGMITKRGLLSPMQDVPAGYFLGELARKGIHVETKEEVLEV